MIRKIVSVSRLLGKMLISDKRFQIGRSEKYVEKIIKLYNEMYNVKL
jgi:hypothetical protein